MKKIIRKISFAPLAMSALLLACAMTSAQQISTPQEGKKTISAVSSGVSGSDGRVSLKLKRGGHIAVDNRTTGRIRIIGWDGDTVEAVATSERGVEAVRFSVKESDDQFIRLKADYLKREEDDFIEPETPQAVPEGKPTPSPSPETPGLVADALAKLPLRDVIRKPGFPFYDDTIRPPMRDGRPLEVHLEVKVPRYAEIELIKVVRSNVEVIGVETPIVVLGDKGDVVLKGVGKAEVRTRNGSVEIEDVAGYAEVITSGGAVNVRRAGGDVRVLSISGNIQIECVRGRVNVDTADGSIVLADIQGDVEANASNSNVLFTGAIRADGRYHLKTMSGAVEMAVRDKPPGFTAALSSYRGTIENDFQLQIKRSMELDDDSINRRIVGNYGNGQAQITLDSFDGKVKLAKTPPGTIKECKMQN
jgi:hypothetical protein